MADKWVTLVVREVRLPLGWRPVDDGDGFLALFDGLAAPVLELRADGSVTWRDDAEF